MRRWLAAGAAAEDRQVIEVGSESVVGDHPLAQGGDSGVIEIDHGAARGADQVVMRVVMDKLEMPHALTEVGFRNNAQIAQAFKGAVDRGEGDRRHDRRDPPVDRFRGDMSPGFGDRLEHGDPLRRRSLIRIAEQLGGPSC